MTALPFSVHAESNAQVSPTQSQPKSPGDQLFAQAIAQLDRRSSVSARIRHLVGMPGQQLLTGRGSYWQQGSGDELRVRFELQIAGQEASLLQVSNNRFLWTERRLPVGRTVTRVKLWELRADAINNSPQLGDIQPGNASWTSTPSELIAQSGGLPSMLSSLQENFTFLPPQPMRLVLSSQTEGQTASIPYFATVGHWRKEKLAAILPPKDGETAKPDEAPQVPARLPEEVLIFFGQSDLFPYRLEYRKLQTPVAANQAGAAIPYQLAANPMVVLEFEEVQFDVAIDAGQFNYAPGDSDFTDQTESALQRIRQRREQQLAERAQAVHK
jgi:hypothetical protein